MNVVITGGGGFLGMRLAKALLRCGQGPTGGRASSLERLIVFDRGFTERLSDPRVEHVEGDITDAGAIRALIAGDVGLVFHLAAVVSSHAEADFDLGMAVNVDGSRLVLEAARRLEQAPRVVFTSSVAVFGPAEVGGDDGATAPPPLAVDPRSSYGAEKAIGELLLKEYARRGFVDGVVLRLPTISVRPGLPNKAASSFASSIIREPLSGVDTICPVSSALRLWLLSPDHAVRNLIHAAAIPQAALEGNPIIDLPGLSVTVAEMVAALRGVAGPRAVAHIAWDPDPAIERIVASWPSRWDDSRARALGFTGDRNFVEVVQTFAAEQQGVPAV